MTARPGRAAGPGLGVDPAPWLVLGVCGSVLGIGGLVWLGGSLAALATGHGWHPPVFGTEYGGRLLHRRLDLIWPGTPTNAVLAASGVLLAAAVGLAAAGFLTYQRRRPVPGDPLPSLARPADVASLTPCGVRARAVGLRPSLGGKKEVSSEDAGLPLGDLVQPGRTRAAVPLRAS